MNSRKFDLILDECLSRMDRGESLIEILDSYPSQAKNLKPLMLAAMLSRSVPQPVPGYTALRQGKNEMLAEMASMQAEGTFLKPKLVKLPREPILDRWIMFLKKLQPAYRFAMLTMVVILTGGFFTVSTSASGVAEDIMDTLFFSFEQVGNLLLIEPSPPKIMGDNPFLSGDYDLPDSPQNHTGNLKDFLVDEDDRENHLGEEFLDQIQTREYSLSDKYEVDEVDEVIDATDLEKEEKEEEKDLEKEEKEEDKDLKEEEKDEEKEDKEEEKAADKAEKVDRKEADRAEKEAEKEEKEDEKEKEK